MHWNYISRNRFFKKCFKRNQHCLGAQISLIRQTITCWNSIESLEEGVKYVKVNNKNTRTTGTYFTPFSNVSIFEFEQVNVSWEMNRFQCNQKRAYHIWKAIILSLFSWRGNINTHLPPTTTLTTLSRWSLHHSSTLFARVALNNARFIYGLSQAW